MRPSATPPSARVDSPTTVDAGHGTAGALLATAPAGGIAVLYDPAVEPLVEVVVRSHRHRRVVCRPVERAPTLDDVEAVRAWLRSCAATVVVAVGGGRVLDLAKLGAALAGAPGSLPHLRGLARRAGYARLPRQRAPRLPVLAVPTTLGTGSEVSPVAVVEDGGDRTLVYSPLLRPAAAALDPQATATLPIRLVREGALEALLRVAGPEIGSASSLRMATTEARLLNRQLARTLDECGEGDEAGDELRLFVAQLSGATHRGWALTGRSAFPSPLWFLGSELSVVLDVTKMAATELLAPTWLGRVAEGNSRWGDRERLAAVWSEFGGGPAGDDVAEAARGLLRRWGVAPARSKAPADAAAVAARRVVRRWGGRLPMLGRFGAEEIEALIGEALAARPAALAGAGR